MLLKILSRWAISFHALNITRLAVGWFSVPGIPLVHEIMKLIGQVGQGKKNGTHTLGFLLTLLPVSLSMTTLSFLELCLLSSSSSF